MAESPEERVARIRDKMVKIAKAQLGKPYKYGAPSYGVNRYFDCSSLVQYIYKRVGIDIPRCTIDQAAFMVRIPTWEAVKIGDLIFIKGEVGRYNQEFPDGIGHVYIVTGEHEMIHAQAREEGGGSVVTGSLADVFAQQIVTAICRELMD